MNIKRTLFLARHADTGRSGTFVGHTDVSLSSRGRRQAERMAVALEGADIDSIFSSDLRRCRETVAPIQARLGIEPIWMSSLRERGFGKWEGMAWSEVQQAFPDVATRFRQDWIRTLPPEAEALDRMRRRLTAAWEEIFQQPWSSCLVVAHAGVNTVLLGTWLGLDLEELGRLRQDYGAINQVEFHQGAPVLVRLNVSCSGDWYSDMWDLAVRGKSPDEGEKR